MGTGLLIFIKPGTTSQLAAGFFISGIFFVLHVKTSAYQSAQTDELQFCSMLSITLTLFGGVLLNTNTQDEDPAGLFLMTFLLMVINVGVIFLFLYLSWKGLTGTGTPAETDYFLDKAKQLALETVVEECKCQATSAVMGLGYTEDEAESFGAMMDSTMCAMQEMQAGKCQEIVESLQALVIGEDETVELLVPIATVFLSGAATGLQKAGCPKEATDKLETYASTLAAYVVESGFEDFSTKWNDGVLSMISDLGSNIEITDFGTIVDQIIELFECADVAHLAEEAEQASPTSMCV